MSKERDYSPQHNAAIRKKERELAKTEAKAEAAVDSMVKGISGALKNEINKKNINRHAIDIVNRRQTLDVSSSEDGRVVGQGGIATDVRTRDDLPWEREEDD